jgi:hypothetical protein
MFSETQRKIEMNKHKIMSAFVLALFMATLLAGGSALAASEKGVAIAFQYLKIQTLESGDMWIDTGGLHIRNRVDLGLVKGDISGSARVVYNADFPLPSPPGAEGKFLPVPDSGVTYGKIEITPIGLDKPSPGWAGGWAYTVSKGKVVSGSMSAWNNQTGQVMLIQKVTQNHDGSLSHEGYVQYTVPCGLPSCPKTP